MDNSDLAQLLILVLLLALSAFFSSAETAMTTVSRIRVRTLVKEENRKALILQRIIDEHSKMLSSILIGNNLVNISASSLATTIAIHLFGHAAVGIFTGLLTLLVLIFGEITPKTLASANAEKLSLSYAPFIWRWMQLMTPVIFLVNSLSSLVLKLFRSEYSGDSEILTEEELRTYLEVGHETGVIENQEHQVISNVFDFISSQVKEVMVPRIDMVTVDEQDTYEAIHSVFQKEKLTRLPVFRENPNNIVGVINIKDFLFCDPENFAISQIMYEPYYTYEHKKSADLFREMRQESFSLTIVLDEYGQCVGMVTMEDLLEELVGDIRDEFDGDEKNLIRQVAPDEYVIEGSVKLTDINDALGLHLDSEEYDSIGGYLIEHLDHLPTARDEVVTEEGHVLRVLKVSQNRIDKVRLILRREAQEENAASVPVSGKKE